MDSFTTRRSKVDYVDFLKTLADILRSKCQQRRISCERCYSHGKLCREVIFAVGDGLRAEQNLFIILIELKCVE